MAALTEYMKTQVITSKWIPRYHSLFMRQLDRLIADGWGRDAYIPMRRMVGSMDTKRMIFDARQAQVFDGIGEIRISGEKLKPPFSQFFMEFTEPVYLTSQQPGFRDGLVAMIYLQDAVRSCVTTSSGQQQIDLDQVVFVMINEENGQWVDRAWSISLDMKKAFVSRKMMYMEENKRACAIVEDADLTGNIMDGLFEAGMQFGGEHREPSWWENIIQDYTGLILWMFGYMMTKSVKIEEMPLPRQQRRAIERAGHTPQPWHRVFVEPSVTGKQSAEQGGGSSVGYRFDVIGHLRVNKHKLRDGSYREVIEWVPDHMRGLANELYIPKTYAVSGGKKHLATAQNYFGDEPRLSGVK